MPPILYPITFVLALALERLAPARPQPPVRRWLITGLAFFAISGVASAVIPAAIARLLAGVPVLPLGDLPLGLAAVLGFVATDLAAFALHRAMHASRPLWRFAHQLHHAAERVDVAGFAFSHPLDLVAMFAATALVGTLLGLPPLAIELAAFARFAAGVVQHLNVRTPRWLGYVLQRPEAHSVHHMRGVHAYNYGTLVWWDMLCGSYRNPDGFAVEAGFGRAQPVGALLIGRDVTAASNS